MLAHANLVGKRAVAVVVFYRQNLLTLRGRRVCLLQLNDLPKDHLGFGGGHFLLRFIYGRFEVFENFNVNSF